MNEQIVEQKQTLINKQFDILEGNIKLLDGSVSRLNKRLQVVSSVSSVSEKSINKDDKPFTCIMAENIKRMAIIVSDIQRTVDETFANLEI